MGSSLASGVDGIVSSDGNGNDALLVVMLHTLCSYSYTIVHSRKSRRETRDLTRSCFASSASAFQMRRPAPAASARVAESLHFHMSVSQLDNSYASFTYQLNHVDHTQNRWY